VEDYLKGLYVLQQKLGAGQATGPASAQLVSLGHLAQKVGVTAGTATVMVKRLAERGLIDYEARVGAKLTARGELQALSVLRRHRLIELFLVEVMGLDWGEVHEEAEVLEHAVSERLLARMDEMLGKPSYDPHGDPIPEADGTVVARELVALSQCPLGRAVVARLGDHSEQFLGFAKERGLTPDTAIEIVGRDLVGDTVALELENGGQVQLGTVAAGKIFVVQAGG